MSDSDPVWQCRCGCRLFRILQNGLVVCNDCDGYFPAAKVSFQWDLDHPEQRPQ